MVQSTGDLASAKALHSLRMAGDLWLELEQMTLEKALEESEVYRIAQRKQADAEAAQQRGAVLQQPASFGTMRRKSNTRPAVSKTSGAPNSAAVRPSVEPVPQKPLGMACG